MGFAGSVFRRDHLVIYLTRSIGLQAANQEDYEFLIDLFEAGKVLPVIGKRFPLSMLVEALKYLEDGHALGKVVISMEDTS